MTRRYFGGRGVLVGLVLAWSATLAGAAEPGRATGAAAGTPAAVVEALHGTLLGMMKEATALGYEGRRARIVPVLGQTFDLEFMARFALGRRWKDLSAGDQQRWREAFAELTAANYAGRFTGFSGEHFETVGEEPAEQDTVFVRTVLVRPDAENVELTYRLRKTSAGWRIIDIYQKGTVSELALRRSEYATVLKRDGFDKLLVSVQGKIADLAAGKVAPTDR